MNAEPEIYPPEALADEEPRYLRRQKPLEIRRRKFNAATGRVSPLVRGRRRLLRRRLAWLMQACASSCFRRACSWLPRSDRNHRQPLRVPGVITEKFSPGPRQKRRARSARCPSRLARSHSLGRAGQRRNASLPNRDSRRAWPNALPSLSCAPAPNWPRGRNGVILERPLDGDFAFPVVSGFGESMPLADRAEAHEACSSNF